MDAFLVKKGSKKAERGLKGTNGTTRSGPNGESAILPAVAANSDSKGFISFLNNPQALAIAIKDLYKGDKGKAVRLLIDAARVIDPNCASSEGAVGGGAGCTSDGGKDKETKSTVEAVTTPAADVDAGLAKTKLKQVSCDSPRGKFAATFGSRGLLLTNAKGVTCFTTWANVSRCLVVPSPQASSTNAKTQLVVLILAAAVPFRKGSTAVVCVQDTPKNEVRGAITSLMGNVSIETPSPSVYRSSETNRFFLKCYMGVNDGALYPLKSGLLFLKPFTFVPHSEIAAFGSGREGAGARFADIVVARKDGMKAVEFSNIERAEMPSLQQYIADFKPRDLAGSDKSGGNGAGEDCQNGGGENDSEDNDSDFDSEDADSDFVVDAEEDDDGEENVGPIQGNEDGESDCDDSDDDDEDGEYDYDERMGSGDEFISKASPKSLPSKRRRT